MTRNLLRSSALLAVLSLGLAACGSDDAGGSAAESTSAETGSPTAETEAAPAPDQPFGPGCSAVPAEGAGSFQAMAEVPVAAAASSTPSLGALTQAVTAAGLADSLNTQDAITVFAPADPAFDAVPDDQLNALLADTARLTAVLTHHVIAGRLTPDQLAGTHTTLNNDEITVALAGGTFTIAGAGTLTQTDASVLCGNVQTANATVYIIDQVLAPAAAK